MKTYRGWMLQFNDDGYVATKGSIRLTAHSRVEIERKIDTYVDAAHWLIEELRKRM